MGRAPCCEKMGLKRGPWTKDEDQLLINYINENGHGNWRALPKKAGLLRCGKSCRLRWTNYLRPDIKRGNFSPEDEDAIIELHKELGNKWSAIAARLPGRTDNEIKNVWHTHLKKRLNPPVETVKRIRKRAKTSSETKKEVESTTPDKPESSESHMQEDTKNESKGEDPNSPSQSTSENNSSVTATTTNDAANGSTMSEVEKFLQVDEDFWSDVISGDYSSITTCDLPGVNSEPYVPVQSTVDVSDFDPYPHDDMEFWYNIFTRDGEIQDLLEL